MTYKTPKDRADEAAEAIRALNHATLSPRGGEGWTYPSDAYDVIGGLAWMAGGLHQATEQIWSMLSGLAVDGHVYSTRGEGGLPELDVDMAGARLALDVARAAADQLVTALNHAHFATANLAWKD